MKKILFTIVATVLVSSSIFGQSKVKNLPDVKLKDLEGTTIQSGDFENEEGPIIVSFWATWCKPCILELVTISETYEDWQAETGVKLIAISIDDARNSHKVAPFVNGRGWDYEVFIDENGDFKRTMGVVNVPHTFVLNGDKEIVYQHPSFSPGDEDTLYEVIQNVSQGLPIGHGDEGDHGDEHEEAPAPGSDDTEE